MTSVSTQAGPTPSAQQSDQVVVIQARKGWVPVDVGEIWRYRELLGFLALRDIRVRYKQSVLGGCWAIIQPIMTMVVFTVLFSMLMGADRMPTMAGVPYPISTFCALVPWGLFASSLNRGGSSLVGNAALVTKVYFPRLILPASSMLASLVDFLIAFGVLVVMIAGYHLFTDYQFHFSWAILTLPFFVLLAMATALAVSLWFAALNAIYRDVGYIVPFLIQIWMYATPIVYSTQAIREGAGDRVPQWLWNVYSLNPMVGVVEAFRWALLGGPAPSMMLGVSVAVVAALMVGGSFYFRRMERSFADLV